jgi:hypothetical protein
MLSLIAMIFLKLKSSTPTNLSQYAKIALFVQNLMRAQLNFFLSFNPLLKSRP